MLYRLNLKDEKQFNTLLKNGTIAIDYHIKEDSNNIEKYLEKIVLNKYESKRNASILINSLKKLRKDDFIWVRFKDNYALCKVLEETKFMFEGIPISIGVKSFKVDSVPISVERAFNKVTMQRILSEDVLKDSIEIFTKLKDKDNKIKNELEEELIDFSKTMSDKKVKNEIVPYKKKIKRHKNDDKNINAGELIIELYSSKDKETNREINLPVVIEEKDKNEIYSLSNTYMDILQGQINLYLKTQELIMQEFYRVQKMILEKYLD